MTVGSTCPVCGADHAPSDVRCQSCGAQIDALLVDLAEPEPTSNGEVAEAPRRTKEVLTVTAVLLGLAIGAGFLFSGGDEPDPIRLAVPPGDIDSPVAATPQPFPTPLPFPRPTVAPPTPTPDLSGEGLAGEPEVPDLTSLAPLLGEVSGLSLAWRAGGTVHILDLDTGQERQVEVPGASADSELAAVDGRIVVRFGNRLHVVEPDDRVRDLTIPGGVDQIFVAPGDRGVWVVRYPRSMEDAPRVAFLDADALAAGTEPAWSDLPRFAYPSAAVTARGLIVGLWQGRPFLFDGDGTFEQLPYDGVVAAAANHLLTFTCEGGTDLTCAMSLVDLGTGSVAEVAIDPSQPWDWRLSPDGRHLYWLDWSTTPPVHFVADLATGEVDPIESAVAAGEDLMRFSPGGEWLVDVRLETVWFHRVADGDEVEIPVDTGRVEGSHALVVFSTARAAA